MVLLNYEMLLKILQRLQNWFRNRTSDKSGASAGLLRRLSSHFGNFGHKRRLSKPRELYSRLYYASRVRHVYEKRCAASPKLSKGKLLALRNTVTDEVFSKEDEDTKRYVAMLLDLEKVTVEEPKDGAPRTALQLQLYVSLLFDCEGSAFDIL